MGFPRLSRAGSACHPLHFWTAWSEPSLCFVCLFVCLFFCPPNCNYARVYFGSDANGGNAHAYSSIIIARDSVAFLGVSGVSETTQRLVCAQRRSGRNANSPHPHPARLPTMGATHAVADTKLVAFRVAYSRVAYSRVALGLALESATSINLVRMYACGLTRRYRPAPPTYLTRGGAHAQDAASRKSYSCFP